MENQQKNVVNLYKSSIVKLLLPITVWFLSGCSIKNYEHTNPKIIIIKSPQLKFADLGYVRNSGDAVELELFIAGKSVKKIEVNHLICVDEGCISKKIFNKNYLNEHYPEDLLQNIILGHAIYHVKNRINITNGFEQKIVDEYVNIMYKVTDEIIFFKDKKNGIIIKIKEIEHE